MLIDDLENKAHLEKIVDVGGGIHQVHSQRVPGQQQENRNGQT